MSSGCFWYLFAVKAGAAVFVIGLRPVVAVAVRLAFLPLLVLVFALLALLKFLCLLLLPAIHLIGLLLLPALDLILALLVCVLAVQPLLFLVIAPLHFLAFVVLLALHFVEFAFVTLFQFWIGGRIVGVSRRRWAIEIATVVIAASAVVRVPVTTI